MVANAGGKKLSSLPFPAIVGQEELKRVLLSVAANDGLDGALIVGEKGTAKSTAVRALVDLLPEQRAVADCPYGCSPDDPDLQCADCRDRDPDDLPVETRPVPLVTLPLGATRDRVVGTLSVEDALAGEADFDPGLLARAHRGILYVDEVNLLDDHLVDVILDAAASGVNTVERDGISVSHPADFTLIGTMNPEEGDLRPQLRDRFALQASVEGCREIDDRVEIIDRALEADGGESDPRTEYADEVDALREDLTAARDRLSRVDLPTEFKAEIADLCLEAGVDGHRGDVATARTAMTIAALEGRETVIESDVHEAATYTLPHRLRSTPFEDEPDLDDLLEDRFDEESPDAEDSDAESDADDGDGTEGADGEDGDAESEPGDGDEGGDRGEGNGRDGDDNADDEDSSDGAGSDGDEDSADTDDGPERRPDDGDRPESANQSPAEAGDGGSDDGSSDGESDSEGSPDDGDGDDETAQPLVPGQQRAEIGEAAAPDLESPTVDGGETAAATGSRASTSPSTDNRGARVRTEPASGEGSIDAAASVRSAAARGGSRVGEDDLRQSVRTGDTSVTIVFAVDASASMRPAMRTAKGVVLELLRDSYEHRDRVAFVAFAGEDADVLLPPTDSVSLAARHLKDLPSGDRTPLPAGLETSRRVIERAETDASVVVLVTDGRANVADGSPTEATRRAARALGDGDTRVVVVDAGDDSRAGLSELVAGETEGELVALESLSVETVRAAAERAADETRR
ncbi:protporphyrin IX magnesium chelatase [Natrinema pellirubrum DSM 15624]|uniref:Mg-chelatase subunit ChlI n=1 Tax=Natrinema pellirubrum (strain DSM 15624 / CIP 106293 / JCM 10476 / NCIMB 786 / 157) TaxID=797303 RepID=L0JNV4_NATP1|nr:VWA domain-containing protein [Natrinema pellirubrum]AGB32518.1 Mg-chelatase subunit ChlI [Natrinema pellirubrum DSM 15624]ELY73657.1 protporphyrin IX magnesium chelatase [Natrinema pellirubrum DSM 15624]